MSADHAEILTHPDCAAMSDDEIHWGRRPNNDQYHYLLSFLTVKVTVLIMEYRNSQNSDFILLPFNE